MLDLRGRRPAPAAGRARRPDPPSPAPDEPLLALVYFPIWDAPATPFGDAAEPGSHALAVTARRFLLSHNSHRRASTPTVVNIPFESVLAVEWGSSLLSGWATLRHAAAAGTAATTRMYRSTGGRHHLAAALRAYRQTFPSQEPATPATVPWDTVRAAAPPALVAEMAPLLLDGESARSLLQSRELWQPGRGLRRRPVCRSHQGLLAATDRGLLLAERAPAAQRSVLDVAVRCLAAPWASLEAVADLETPAARQALASLATIVSLIASTTTTAGLRVRSEIDKSTYPQGVSPTDKEVAQINFERHPFHGDWNYTIHPAPPTSQLFRDIP
jgi:Rhodopirellula transposase DDE domain